MKVPEKWPEKEAKKIPVMQSLRFPGHDRAELMMYLPADWMKPDREKRSEEEKQREQQPFKLLLLIALTMVRTRSWLSFSQTMEIAPELAFPGAGHTDVVFLSPLPDCRTPGFTLKVGDKNVSVLQVLPISKNDLNMLKAIHPVELLRYVLHEELDAQKTFIENCVNELKY